VKGRKYYDSHKEQFAEYHTKYAQENKEQLKDYARHWRTSPAYREYLQRPEVIERKRLNKREWDRKRAEDPLFRISNNVRTSMCHALKGKKGFRKWETLVGYTLEDLIKHLSPLMDAGMTWDNYGDLWQVDHVTPKSWYKYDSAEHPLFKECWALNNLQPKLSKDNRKKGNRFKG
jgi:hypothetical protein